MGGLLLIAVLAVPVVIAITFHEAAHGYAAHLLGDDTAEREGRLTLNPLAHIDQWGTLLLPAVMLLTLGIAFGYAKPVPIEVEKLKNPKRDIALIAVSGPLVNLLLALTIALLFLLTRSLSQSYPLWQAVLHSSIVVNFILIILNLIPLPPLDASKLFTAIWPGVFSKAYELIEPYGYLIVILFILVFPLVAPMLGVSWDVTGYYLIRPAYNLTDLLLSALGAT